MGRRGNTRERLVEAAVTLIDEHGVDRLRLSDVAAAVGIAEPSVYKSFASKDALVVAASIVRYERGLLDVSAAFVRLVEQAQSREDFRAAVRTTLQAAFDEKRAPLRASRLNVIDLAQNRPELAEQVLAAQRRTDEVLGAALARAAASGWIRSDVEPAALGLFAYTVINGRTIIELDPRRSHAAEWDRLAIECVLAAFEGAPPASTDTD
jgi:AcrR family transcriptional regulator